MKTSTRALAFLLLVVATAGCVATRPTAGGGHETTLLGGLVTVSEKSFAPPSPTSVDVDLTKGAGDGVPSGTKTTLLWGAITLHDY
jgi:hypothetical protein